MSNSSNRKLCQCKKCCQKSSAGKLVAYSTFRRHAVLELTQSQSSVFVEYLASVSATASASGTSVNLQLGVPANTGSSSDTSGGNLDQDMDDVEAEDNEDVCLISYLNLQFTYNFVLGLWGSSDQL